MYYMIAFLWRKTLVTGLTLFLQTSKLKCERRAVPAVPRVKGTWVWDATWGEDSWGDTLDLTSILLGAHVLHVCQDKGAQGKWVGIPVTVWRHPPIL